MVVPLPTFTRIALICSRSCCLGKPLLCDGQESRDRDQYTDSPERKTTRNQIKNRWTRHANDKQPMWRPHRSDSGPKPTWWHTFCGSNWSLHYSWQKRKQRCQLTSHKNADRWSIFARLTTRPATPMQKKKQCDNANNLFTYTPQRKTTHTLSVATAHQHWLSLLFTRIYVTSVNMSAIMAAGQTTPKRSQIQQHRSINAHTKEKNHKLRNQKSKDNVCKTIYTTKHISDHIVTALQKSNLGGTHPRAPTLEISKIHAKNSAAHMGIQHLRGSLGHVRNHGGSSQQSERHPSNHLLARAEDHKHTEHKLHVATYNRIAQPYIVPNTSWRLKNKSNRGGTHPHDPKLESSRHMRINECRVPSFWIFANRPNMFAIMSAGQSTQMRTRIPQWHKSMNAITQTENHKHPKQVSLVAACERFSATDQSAKHIMENRQLGGTNLHAPTLECPLIRPHQKKRCSPHTTQTSGLREHVCNLGDRQAILMQSTIWRWHPSIHTLTRTG